MTKLEASMTQLANKAAAGDLKAIRFQLQMASRFPELIADPECQSIVIRIVDPKVASATKEGDEKS